MKKTLILVLVFSMLLTAVPSHAQPVDSPVSQKLMEDTIRALGIMNGDNYGYLRLYANVKRSEFAQMMVQASTYKNSGSGGSNTSIFKDVSHLHWAAEPIKIAVNAGWFSGYLDGTFKPDNYIKLEEAATAILKLLGYTPADLNGAYPTAQLNKFNTLGLNDGVAKSAGDSLTRGDLLTIFYNLMETQTKDNRYYGESLGHLMTNGRLDYGALVSSVTKGPFVYQDGNIFDALPFNDSNTTFFKNGKEINPLTLIPYDIYYYSENLRTLWAYNQKVSGLFTEAVPSLASPTSIVVAGNTYALGNSSATHKVSSRGDFSIGETITLLVGMNGDVVDVIAPELADSIQYGVVTNTDKLQYQDGAGRIIINNSVTVACTDGVLRQYLTDGTLFAKGNIVSVTTNNTESIVKIANQAHYSGALNASVTKYGRYEISEDIEIIDTDAKGNFTSISPKRLEDTLLSSYNILYFTLNEMDQVNRMILNNVTGDIDTYGIVTDVEETETLVESQQPLDPQAPPVPPVVTMNGVYQYQINGTPGVYRTNGRLLEISEGPSVFWYKDGLVDDIYSMNGFILDTLTSLSATRLNETYKVAEDVQVYQRIDGEYFLVNVASVTNTNEFHLVGYRDSGHRAGGLIRVIVASRR